MIRLKSGGLDSDMQKEMLLQKRNLMMRLRMIDASGAEEFRKYDFDNANNFDSELIERKMKKG
jgi:hypothetical protein